MNFRRTTPFPFGACKAVPLSMYRVPTSLPRPDPLPIASRDGLQRGKRCPWACAERPPPFRRTIRFPLGLAYWCPWACKERPPPFLGSDPLPIRAYKCVCVDTITDGYRQEGPLGNKMMQMTKQYHTWLHAKLQKDQGFPACAPTCFIYTRISLTFKVSLFSTGLTRMAPSYVLNYFLWNSFKSHVQERVLRKIKAIKFTSLAYRHLI